MFKFSEVDAALTPAELFATLVAAAIICAAPFILKAVLLGLGV